MEVKTSLFQIFQEQLYSVGSKARMDWYFLINEDELWVK